MSAASHLKQVYQLGFSSKTVNDLSHLCLVVSSAVSVETCTMLCSSLIEHAEEVRHFLESSILISSRTDNLEARADSRTDGTVDFGQLLGLTNTLFARLMIWHLYISG